MSARSDFRLYHGNDLEMLAGVLAAEMAKSLPGVSVLAPETVLIPQVAMKRWLQQTLAARHGVAANLRFLTPGEFVREALGANLEGGDDAAIAQAAPLRWRLWRLLAEPALTREPRFAPLRALLDRGDRARAAWTLADELAAAFEKYQAWRRDWLLRWDAGAEPQDWQAELWRRATRGEAHRGARLQAYLARHGGADGAVPQGLPSRLFVFACQNVSPDVLRVIASAARAAPLHFFFVSPVASWWGDLRTVRERLREAPDTVFAADEETPMLRANGAAGRDFLRLLFDFEVVHPTYELALYAPPDPTKRQGLHRMQRDLLARRAPVRGAAREALPAFDEIARADDSLQIHACATRLRELQVLHDRLRALFEADPTLEARDIAVLAPDIERYAPQVHAVFGALASTREFIPYAVADAGAQAGLPLIATFLRLLALPDSRFGANEILDLLAQPAVAQRLDLARADFGRLRDWVDAAGARWGLDAAHRVALDAPEDAAYTWVWALERLLLGHASGSDAEIEGVAPLPLIEGEGLLALDALLHGLRLLARLRREFQQTQSAQQWQARLLRAMDDLFASEPEAVSDRRALDHLRATVAGFAKEVAQAGLDTPIPPALVRDWFGAALAEPESRQPFLTGGVTFARMVPMRLLPFRVICVLGLDDAAYPRRDAAGGLNRIAAALGSRERRVGDRSLREEDRGLFLQLFSAATDVFYLSYLGLDPRTGETLPPSVVVSELIDTAAEAFRDPDAARQGLVVTHPLQPFAPQAFGVGDARRFSYRGEWRVEPDDEVRIELPRFAAFFLPSEEGSWEEPCRVRLDAPNGETNRIGASKTHPTAPSEQSLDELRRDLANPARAFLRHHLGLRLDRSESRLPDSEPFGREDALHEYALKQRLFAALTAQEPAPDTDTLARRLLAEARLSPAAAGRERVAQLRASLAAARVRWRTWAQGDARRERVAVTLGEQMLQASFAPVHDNGLLQFRAGKAHGRTRLDLALEWLLWSASGEARTVHRLVLEQGAQQRVPLAATTARASLMQLLALQARARQTALPLMPDSAWTFVEALQEGRGEDEAFERARVPWEEGFRGEGRNPWTQLALRGADPFAPGQDAAAAQFRSLARELFDSLHESVDAAYVRV